MSGKQKWWNPFSRARTATGTVDPPDPENREKHGEDAAPSMGDFSFVTAEEARAPQPASTVVADTQPNPALTTGRLEALGLAPVLVPSLAEQALLHRVAAQALADPGAALARWEVVLSLFPCDVDARAGAARALSALERLPEASAAWRAVLEVEPQHSEALASVAPTEERRHLSADGPGE